MWNICFFGDQVLMVVMNIHRFMVEYHDILWDIGKFS